MVHLRYKRPLPFPGQEGIYLLGTYFGDVCGPAYEAAEHAKVLSIRVLDFP